MHEYTLVRFHNNKLNLYKGPTLIGNRLMRLISNVGDLQRFTV